MWFNIFWLLLGLVLILWGANALTDGSSAIARRMGISDLVVGLTVVAFGTSAPELVISILSAIKGNSELAIGNVVGSNIFNILMIIGVTAMVRPIKVTDGIMTREIPLVVLSSLVLLVMANAPMLDGTAAQPAIGRSMGIILLLFFAIFMRYTFAQAHNAPDSASDTEAKTQPMNMAKASLLVVAGLAALIYGGDRFVAGASGIAASLGVSDAIIGLTIVAAGTSLPELATSVAAALKGKPGIALGNVIGSNIFNIFLVLGSAATISRLPLGNIGNFDLLTLTAASLLFWIMGWLFGKRVINRAEGVILTLFYLGYVGILVAAV